MILAHTPIRDGPMMQPSPSRFASQHLLALHPPPFVPTLAPFRRRQTTSSPGPKLATILEWDACV
ncbi:hypothetical protein L226DRAFT_531418 [Lentinus tigrinus ALCF2SS1-7]|uniref:uncharacterized protein n=1 Tax=Lentinus tigrinus ALCF2SS1-7 TaxID=1328758 RepID=UPI001165DF19|nr:hypothetical protein L226DRAFT_531418 [Lentinus tigrinus ALCF2SS1-7]